MNIDNRASIVIGDRKLELAAPNSYQLSAILAYALRADSWRDSMSAFMGTRILDVGANIGSYAVMMALAKPDASIVCIEPSSHSWEYLQYNTRAFPRVECVNVAVSDKRHMLTIGLPAKLNVPGNTGQISAHGYVDDEYKETVEAVPLDDWADDDISFIKMDIEGHELQALKGMDRILTERRPNIFIEINPVNLIRAGLTDKDIVMYLASCRYGFGSVVGGRDSLFLPA